ncbi:MAG: SBBP repeat-containing protein [Phycisphaerales bacterium]
MAVLLLLMLRSHEVRAEQPYQIEWSLQFGSSDYDTVEDLVVDNDGNAYICGWGVGNLFGAATSEKSGYLVKLDPSGLCYGTAKQI